MGTKILRGAHKSYLLVSKIPLFGWINKLQGVCLFLGYKVFCVGICENIKNIIKNRQVIFWYHLKEVIGNYSDDFWQERNLEKLTSLFSSHMGYLPNVLGQARLQKCFGTPNWLALAKSYIPNPCIIKTPFQYLSTIMGLFEFRSLRLIE